MNGLPLSASSPMSRSRSVEIAAGEPRSVEAGVEASDLLDRQFGLEAGCLQLDAQPRFRFDRPTCDIDAIDGDRAVCCGGQPLDRAESAGLAGTVRPEQSEDLAARDVEAHLVHCGAGAIADGQLGHFEDKT